MRKIGFDPLLFFSPLIVLALVLILNLTGFCWQKFKYLSYQEKVEAIYTQINKLDTVRIGDSDIRYKRIPYSSFEEFNRENPNCCETNFQGSGEQALPNFFDSLTGFHFERVRLSIKDYYEVNGVKYLNSSKNPDNVVGLKSCGKFYFW